MDYTEQLKDIFNEHKGKENAIYAKDIAKLLEITEDATVPKTRQAIKKFMENSGIPIGGNSKVGYYVVTNDTEFDECIDSLDSRIKGIKDRKATLTKNYRKD